MSENAALRAKRFLKLKIFKLRLQCLHNKHVELCLMMLEYVKASEAATRGVL